jgi:hypothetical protein
MKSFKELKSVIAENRYMVKFEKGGSMKLREYEASSAMAAESKAKVDAQRMGMTVASVRLKEVEKKTKDSPAMDEAHQEVSADFKVTTSGRKVPVQRKNVKDTEDQEQQNEAIETTHEYHLRQAAMYKKKGDERNAKYHTDRANEWQIKAAHDDTKRAEAELDRKYRREETELEEAVTVKKHDYSWGKMVTVHHGSENSYPLHPEHQKKIASLKDGEHTSFKDETNRKVSAHREGDKVHLSGAGSNKKTTVAHSHFTESVVVEQQTHRVSVTVTDPHHPAVTMRNKKYEKRVKVKANDREHAIDSALHYYKKQGLKVHDHNYVGVVENVQIEEAADKEETRLMQLARLGLVDKSNVAKLRMAMEQLKSDKPLSVTQRSLLLGVLEDLFSLVTGDDQVFMRLKRDVQKEEVQIDEGENKQMKGKDPCWKGYQMVGMKDKNGKKVPNCVPEEKDVEENYVSDAQRKAVWASRNDAKKEEVDPPFDPDPPKKNPAAKAGKYGQGYSTARHLARLALKKQQEKQAQKAQNK